MQGSGKPLASAGPGEGTSPPTGTENRSYTARVELPPGLPNTTYEACQELMLAIVAKAMEDKDLRYIDSPLFIVHLCYLGLDMDTAVRVQTTYLMGKVKLHRLSQTEMQRGRRAASPGPA